MSAWELAGIVFQYLGNLISVVLVLAILSGRKEARSTLGWVLLVVTLPYIGSFAYLVFGRPYERHRHDEEPGAAPICLLPPEGLPASTARTTRLTSRNPVTASRLELLAGAGTKYDRLEADLLAAKTRIVMAYYVFRRDGTGRRFLELLARKAEQGVQTCLIYDGWGAIGLGLGRFLEPYRARGLEVKAFHPVSDPFQMSRINYRNHRKIVVIDGKIGYTGSTNIGDEYLGLHHRYGPWKDLHVRVEGMAAWALEGVFRRDWEIASGKVLDASPEPVDPGNTWVHVIPSGPGHGEESLYALLFAQFGAARRRIDILTPYLVPERGLISALGIAARQGVRVRVIVPGRSNHPLVAAAGRSYYDELVEGGVELYETPGMLHAKGVLVDDTWAMVGSANLDNRSFHLNYEINLTTSDPSFCEAYARAFGAWLAEADTIRAEDLNDRSLSRRLLEGTCRTLSPVL